MVDDESKPERRPAKHMQGPRSWDLKHNPAYAYYAYYTYANLFTLNKLREARGLNTFALRPHAGALDLALFTTRSLKHAGFSGDMPAFEAQVQDQSLYPAGVCSVLCFAVQACCKCDSFRTLSEQPRDILALIVPFSC